MHENKSRPKVPVHMLFFNYFSHLILILVALMNEFLYFIRIKKNYFPHEVNRISYSPLYSSFFSFYYRNLFWRFNDFLSFPIGSVPSEKITILERKFGPMKKTFELTGRKREAINFGSYNYLGFAQNTGPITDSVETTIRDYGIGMCTTANELGRHQLYRDLEQLVAKFLGAEDSIIFGMGFATNAYTMSALFGKGCLVLSDELNHSSIVSGCKTSGAQIQVFKHNDMNDLEIKVRNAIIEGQTKTGRDWKKIIVIVEGIYSMEGTIVSLKEIIRIKKKYKLYVYLDEAHSIGAIGSRGRGVCDYYGCDPKDIDILMGTFTKSFAASGGYIAANKRTIAYLRSNTIGFHYTNPISMPIIQQIRSVLTDLMDPESESVCRIKQLKENTVYFRRRLTELGFHIDGSNDSPVIPLMVYMESYLKVFLERLLASGIATIGVGYPVTTLVGVRMRLCVSAAHTRPMIDYTIDCINKIGSELFLNFDRNNNYK